MPLRAVRCGTNMASVGAVAFVILLTVFCETAGADPRYPAAGDDSVFSIVVAGDLLLDRGVRKRIERSGADALFDSVRDIFSGAAAVIANLECPVTTVLSPIEKKYIFRGEPGHLTSVKRAGITHLSVANNHTNDQGRRGFTSTMRNLAMHGLVPIGGGGTQDEACKPVLIRRGGAEIAVFASASLPLENWMYDPRKPGPCQATAAELGAAIRSWKAEHPDGCAIALPHWGWEFHDEPNDAQRADALSLAEAGADAVIGHHPHVAQSVEHIGKTVVLYSLGNFIFDQSGMEAKRCLAAELVFSGSFLREVNLIPLSIEDCAAEIMRGEERASYIEHLRGISPAAGFGEDDGLRIRLMNPDNSRR